VRPAAAVRLVAGRELTERVRQRSFRISTLLVAAGLVAAVVLPRVLAGGGDEALTLGVLPDVPAELDGAATAAARALDVTLELTPTPDLAAGEAALRAGDLDALVAPGEVVLSGPLASDDPLAGVVRVVASALGTARAVAASGLDPDAARRLLAAEPAPERVLDTAADEDPDPSDEPVLFIGVGLLYIALLSYGGLVGTAVVEEKASRVVEVLVATVRPHQLLAGKIVGAAAVALLQLVLVATPALLVVGATGTELPSGSAGTIASLVLWFVLGFAFYATAYAASASLVSRVEEVQNAIFPVTALVVVTYLAVFGVTSSPDGALARTLALFPPTAPLVMPARAALGHPGPWEVPLAVGLSVLATYGLVRLAGRIYVGAVLRFGSRARLRDVLVRAGRDRR